MQLRSIVLVILATVTVVRAGKKQHGNNDKNVGYKFGYAVHDPHTHDIKSHHETRHGKHVVGYYSLKQPDGTTRIVHYKAGPHSGFEAFVEIIGKPQYSNHHEHANRKSENHENHEGHEPHDDHRGHNSHLSSTDNRNRNHKTHEQNSHPYWVHEDEGGSSNTENEQQSCGHETDYEY